MIKYIDILGYLDNFQYHFYVISLGHTPKLKDTNGHTPISFDNVGCHLVFMAHLSSLCGDVRWIDFERLAAWNTRVG